MIYLFITLQIITIVLMLIFVIGVFGYVIVDRTRDIKKPAEKEEIKEEIKEEDFFFLPPPVPVSPNIRKLLIIGDENELRNYGEEEKNILGSVPMEKTGRPW